MISEQRSRPLYRQRYHRQVIENDGGRCAVSLRQTPDDGTRPIAAQWPSCLPMPYAGTSARVGSATGDSGGSEPAARGLIRYAPT
jgi:hypothetical protein